MTIEQIQEMITNKGDVREIINQLADYIQANPGGLPGGSSYLVYTALLSQNSTDAPTVESNGSGANTPFQNTLGGTLVWSYFDVGSFVGTLNGAFLVGKVAIFLSNGENIAFFIGGGRFTDNSIYISTYDDAGNPSNGLLNNTPIEIRVYP